MKIRYLDEDAMADALVTALIDRGIDVTTANLEDMVNRADPEHLDLRHFTGASPLLYNIGDYCQLHTEYLSIGKTHTGIILASQQRFGIGEQMRRLLRIIAVLSVEETQNNLQFLSNWN